MREERDRPTLIYALQGLDGKKMLLPKQRAAWPDRGLLGERYKRFMMCWLARAIESLLSRRGQPRTLSWQGRTGVAPRESSLGEGARRRLLHWVGAVFRLHGRTVHCIRSCLGNDMLFAGDPACESKKEVLTGPVDPTRQKPEICCATQALHILGSISNHRR